MYDLLMASSAISKEKLLPLLLLLAVVIVDQITKALVVCYIPRGTIAASFFGDFFRIIHVRNLAVAFSLGRGLTAGVRAVAFKIAPVIVLCVVMCIYFRRDDFSRMQRWLLCGIIGGGIGNLIDRFFRKEGVVDFLDFKFYGILGFKRWPTFNIADATIVVCVFLFMIYYAFMAKSRKTLEAK